MREGSKVPAWRRWLLLAVGVVLAMMVYIAGYDVGGREPPCNDTSQLQRSHPNAVEFRNAGGGYALTQSCEALDVNGTVVGRETFPGTADLVLAAVMLVAPLTADAAWRRSRRFAQAVQLFVCFVLLLAALAFAVSACVAAARLELTPTLLHGLACGACVFGTERLLAAARTKSLRSPTTA